MTDRPSSLRRRGTVPSICYDRVPPSWAMRMYWPVNLVPAVPAILRSNSEAWAKDEKTAANETANDVMKAFHIIGMTPCE